jgi:hypothetical protein
MTDGSQPTVEAAIGRALAAYDDLVELGETVDDEWSYVQDLAEAWRGRLEDVGRERAGELLEPAVDAAVDAAIGEIGRISDPHRAIDWLSTFPQVALVALGEAR